MRNRVCQLLAVLFAAILLPTTALATVVVPVPSEEMAEDVDAVVTGHVTKIESHWDPTQGQVFTTIAIAVDDVLKGEVDDRVIEVVQPGGQVGGFGSWTQGSPEFHVGERVLVFLVEQPDGSVRVAHLYLGKYSVVSDIESGEELAVRDPNPAGVLVLPSPHGPVLAPSADVEVVGEMKKKIRQHAPRGKPGARLRAGRLRGALAPAVSQANASFNLFANAARWWEPDFERLILFKINTAGEPLAPTRGFSQVRDALAAWSSVPSSSLRLSDGGTTGAQGIMSDGVNAISFRDPFNQIGTSGSRCGGVLAIGAHFFNLLSTKTVNGKTFYRIVEGDLVTNKGWEGCGFYEVYANFAEVITHEVGHTLGFDHASDRNATMYGYIHFDGRGASLTATDKAGVVFVYPGTAGTPSTFTLSVARTGTGQGTVSSTPAGVVCGTDCSEAYTSGAVVDLTAAPQTGSTFAGWSGACSGTGACRVTLTANAAVTATFTTAGGSPGPTPGGPDLVISSVSAPPAATSPGQQFKVIVTIRNAGGAPAGSSRVGFFLAPAGNPAGPRQPLQVTKGIKGLAAGKEIATARAVSVPKTTATGTYDLVACADDGNLVAEADENNNCRTATGTVVVGQADLRVAGISGVPNRTRRSQPFTVTDTTRNDGALAAPATSVWYYLSPTATLGGDGLILRGRWLPALDAGANSTGSATVTLPTKVATGAYYVIACVRGASGDNPANNCQATASRMIVDP